MFTSAHFCSLLLVAPLFGATTLTIAVPVTARTTGTITLVATPTGPAGTVAWTNISGPATGAFGTPTALSTTFGTSSRGDYVARASYTNSDGVTTADVHVGAVVVDANDIVATGASAATNALLGPLTRMGSSPWPYFDITSKALATQIAASGLANPPALGSAIAGTAQVFDAPTLLVGTGTNWNPDLVIGNPYVVAWDAVDGAGSGRLEVLISARADDTHATTDLYDNQIDLGSGLTIYNAPTATSTFQLGWWGLNGGAGNNSWNYYGGDLAQYREYHRTGLTAYLTNFRSIADYWWQWAIDHGRSGQAIPRVAAMQGQFLRALDGHSERFPDLLTFTRYWNGDLPSSSDYNNPASGDIREAGYAQGMLAMGAISDPDATRHATYCGLLVSKTALWIGAQNVDGSWHENLYRFSGLGQPGGYVTNLSVSPWRQAIAIRGLEQSYESLADTSAAGCNNTALAISLLAVIHKAIDFTWNYGRAPGNGGVYFEVLSPQDSTASALKTGTVSVSLGSASVVGVGTLFTGEYNCNSTDYMGLDQTKTIYKVASCADNTHLTLTTNYGTQGEMAAAATTHDRAPAASTACGNSAPYCSPYGATPPNGNTDLTRTPPGMFGWACYYIDSSYCDKGDRWFGVAFGGPVDGAGGSLACAGPYCANLQTDWRGALHACAVDATLPCNFFEDYAPHSYAANSFAYLGKNFGEANGAPAAQTFLAYRLMAPAPTQAKGIVISGRTVNSGRIVGR